MCSTLKKRFPELAHVMQQAKRTIGMGYPEGGYEMYRQRSFKHEARLVQIEATLVVEIRGIRR
jgi:hypothetical protein